jgi:hypothetical protein
MLCLVCQPHPLFRARSSRSGQASKWTHAPGPVTLDTASPHATNKRDRLHAEGCCLLKRATAPAAFRKSVYRLRQQHHSQPRLVSSSNQSARLSNKLSREAFSPISAKELLSLNAPSKPKKERFTSPGYMSSGPSLLRLTTPAPDLLRQLAGNRILQGNQKSSTSAQWGL